MIGVKQTDGDKVDGQRRRGWMHRVHLLIPMRNLRAGGVVGLGLELSLPGRRAP